MGKTCGNGTSIRVRDCYTSVTDRLVYPGNCFGEYKETTSCSEVDCPRSPGNLLMVVGGSSDEKVEDKGCQYPRVSNLFATFLITYTLQLPESSETDCRLSVAVGRTSHTHTTTVATNLITQMRGNLQAP